MTSYIRIIRSLIVGLARKRKILIVLKERVSYQPQEGKRHPNFGKDQTVRHLCRPMIPIQKTQTHGSVQTQRLGIGRSQMPSSFVRTSWRTTQKQMQFSVARPASSASYPINTWCVLTLVILELCSALLKMVSGRQHSLAATINLMRQTKLPESNAPMDVQSNLDCKPVCKCQAPARHHKEFSMGHSAFG